MILWEVYISIGAGGYCVKFTSLKEQEDLMGSLHLYRNRRILWEVYISIETGEYYGKFTSLYEQEDIMGSLPLYRNRRILLEVYISKWRSSVILWEDYISKAVLFIYEYLKFKLFGFFNTYCRQGKLKVKDNIDS